MSDKEGTQIDIPELKTEFLFRRRPVAIPGDLRPGWRIGLLVLLLNNCCRAGRTSLTRLHVLSWGIRTNESRRALRAALSRTFSPSSLVVRFEPFLNRAVDFAIGEGLVRRSGGNKIELTPNGRKLAEELASIETAYVVERQFIEEIQLNVTEALVNHMFPGRD